MKKRVLCFITILLISFIAVSCVDKQKDVVKEDPKFAVATDIHVLANSILTEDNIASYETKDKMIHLSTPIFNTIADKIIEEGHEFLLLCGDLTENGDEVSHQAVTEILHRLENSGVKVYVINGNHDIMSNTARKSYSVTQSRFAELYADFGYNEADSVLPGTLCYSLKINDKFRLIAVDNMVYYTDENQTSTTEEMIEEKQEWIFEQTNKAIEENLLPIYISHRSFLNHWPRLLDLVEEPLPDCYTDICTQIVSDGACLGFTGHNHLNDIKVFRTASGKEYYEVMTGSTCYCQSNYRSVSYSSDKINVKTKTITELNLDTVSPYVSESVINAVRENYVAYAEEHFNKKVNSTVRRYINLLMNKLDFGNKELNNILKNDVVEKTLSMTLYEKDETTEISLERVLKEYGKHLPQTEYKTFWDVIPIIVQSLLKGNENMRNSDEVVIAKYVFYAIFYNIDLNSDKIALCCNDENKIAIDLNKLFSQGVLECYDSNLIPTLVKAALASDMSTKKKLLFAAISEDFTGVTMASGAISALSNGVITSVENYFGEKEIYIEKLVEEGFCDNYMSDLLTDTDPDAREITIEIKHE